MRLILTFTMFTSLTACAPASDSAGNGKSGVDVDPTCTAYLACLAEVDPGMLASVNETYGDGGSCWIDDESATTCSTACSTGLEQMHDAWPDEPACNDGSPVTAYDLEGDWDFTANDIDDCDGTEVKLTTYKLSFYASSDTEFETEGHGTLHIGTTYIIDLASSCTLNAGRFDCGDDPADYDTVWSLSGKYDGSMTATVKVDLGDCDVTYHLTGER